MHAFLTAHSCSLARTRRECKRCHLAILENSVDLLNERLYFFLGRCARGLKTLHLLPLSPSSTHGMLGKQELSGIPSAPPKLFCLSGLAANLEYIRAEDYSRTGTRGSHLLRQTVPVPVRKHPVQVDLAMAHRFPEQLNEICLHILHPKSCSLFS